MENYVTIDDEIVKTVLFLDLASADAENHVGDRKSSARPSSLSNSRISSEKVSKLSYFLVS